jgi:L-lactate dehydrogenase
MKITVGIIGTGWVGSSVAISTLHAGAAQELLLFDARAELAEGEAMDLAHGASFYPAAQVRTASVEEMAARASAVVVSAGRGGKGGESRLELLRDNAAIVRDLGRRLAGFRGIVIMVTNPVDVLTQVLVEASGLPPERVLGTGTMLDTARLRQVLGRELGLDPRSVHAQVVGEHGDSEVVLWSGARVGGTLLADWPGWRTERQEELATEVRRAAYEIIRRKGATNHAIGLVTAALLRWMLRGERRVLTVSRMQTELPGFEGVALSLPTLVGAEGGTQVIVPEMSEAEQAALERSAEVLRQARASIA